MPPDRATKPKGHRHSPIPKKPIRKIKLLHPLDPQPSSIPCNAPPKEGTRLRYIMDYVLVPTSASVGSGLVYRQPPPDIPASPGGGWSSSDEDEDPTWVPDSPSPPKISEPDRTIPPCSLDATLHSRVSSRVSKLAHSLILMIYDAQILQLFPTWQGFLADIGHRIVAFCNSPADPIFALAIQGRGCGYYGSEGALVIGASILELAYGMDEELPHAIRITVEKALRADTTNHFDGYEPNFSLPLFMSYILIPFVATMLIQEDMKTSITVADAYRREGNTRMETVAAGLEWNELPPEDTVTDICDIEAASYTMVEETNGEALLSYPECESETAASHRSQASITSAEESLWTKNKENHAPTVSVYKASDEGSEFLGRSPPDVFPAHDISPCNLPKNHEAPLPLLVADVQFAHRPRPGKPRRAVRPALQIQFEHYVPPALISQPKSSSQRASPPTPGTRFELYVPPVSIPRHKNHVPPGSIPRRAAPAAETRFEHYVPVPSIPQLHAEQHPVTKNLVPSFACDEFRAPILSSFRAHQKSPAKNLVPSFACDEFGAPILSSFRAHQKSPAKNLVPSFACDEFGAPILSSFRAHQKSPVKKLVPTFAANESGAPILPGFQAHQQSPVKKLVPTFAANESGAPILPGFQAHQQSPVKMLSFPHDDSEALVLQPFQLAPVDAQDQQIDMAAASGPTFLDSTSASSAFSMSSAMSSHQLETETQITGQEDNFCGPPDDSGPEPPCPWEVNEPGQMDDLPAVIPDSDVDEQPATSTELEASGRENDSVSEVTFSTCPECDGNEPYTAEHILDRGHKRSIEVKYKERDPVTMKVKKNHTKIRISQMRADLLFRCICTARLRTTEEVVTHFKEVEEFLWPGLKHVYTNMTVGRLV